jgi:dienelactone hydrolase
MAMTTVLFGTLVTPLAAQTPAVVTLKAPDGLSLKASYYSPGKPGPGLVLLHQCNRDRSAWHTFATAAAARGYHVIAMDYRGYGESGGQLLEDPQQQFAAAAEQWPGDVDAAFAWLLAQPGVDRQRIGAAGASCGVNQSVLLARRHPEVKTVMLLSGNVIPEGREYLRKTPWLPVLAAASEDDGNAIDSMKWILGWSANPKNRMVEYKAAGHGTDMFAVEKGLQPLMLEWLDAHLRAAPATPPAVPAPKPTPVQEFWTALAQPGGVAKARVLFDAARRDGTHASLMPEGEANAFGYQLLQEGKAEDAVVVFQMAADAYPESANVYDSLADAHLAAGRPAEALRLAEKALQVLATDTRTPEAFKQQIRESAEQKIRQLKK